MLISIPLFMMMRPMSDLLAPLLHTRDQTLIGSFWFFTIRRNPISIEALVGNCRLIRSKTHAQ
jgi:hypothetical protein